MNEDFPPLARNRCLAGLALTALLLTAGSSGIGAQEPGPEGGPFWELAATSVSPKVTGTSIELVDQRTIRLGNSSPEGWSITFVADEAFQPFGFHASDNRSGRIRAEVKGPSGTCAATGETATRAVLQVAGLDDSAPQGYGTIAGECFGAPAPGVSLTVSFMVAPSR